VFGGTLLAETPTRRLRRWYPLAATAVADENMTKKRTRRCEAENGSTVGRCRRRYTVVGLVAVAYGDYYSDIFRCKKVKASWSVYYWVFIVVFRGIERKTDMLYLNAN
jgi:hypothetical protein